MIVALRSAKAAFFGSFAEGKTTLKNRTSLISGQSRPARRLRFRDRFRYYFFETLEPRNLLATFTVNSLTDGPINPADNVTVFTLREAIQASNTTAGVHTIQFASALTANGPATITLASGQLIITSSLSIIGPGTHLLSIHGNNASRVFNVDDGNARRARNGAVLNVSNSTISGNTAQGVGGGISAADGAIRVTLANSTVANNTGSFGALFVFGDSSNLTVQNSIIANNPRTSTSAGDFADFDFRELPTRTFDNSLVRAGESITGTGNITGVDPLLGPLANRCVAGLFKKFNTMNTRSNML